MNACTRLLFLLLAAVTAAACTPVTASLPGGTPADTAGGALAVTRAPKQPSAYPDEAYPVSTSTPLPYPPLPYPGGTADLPAQLSDLDAFLATQEAAVAAIVDDETPQLLTLDMEPTLQLQPGESHQFTVGVVTCCYFFEEVDVRASWSIAPSAGATIDPATGLFTVDENTPDGTVYTVTADVENGRAAPAVEVHIYSLAGNPLVGLWREEKQLTCPDQEEIVPENIMEELRFDADGRFSVTWYPFERYKDYWGTYRYERETGELVLTIEGGNYVPDEVDTAGLVTLEAGQRLRLKEMWLGSPPNAITSATCGHIFVRSK